MSYLVINVSWSSLGAPNNTKKEKEERKIIITNVPKQGLSVKVNRWIREGRKPRAIL